MSTITHTVKKVTGFYSGDEFLQITVTNGDWRHVIFCERERHTDIYWICRSNVDIGQPYVRLDNALISYCQIARKRNLPFTGHCTTVITEILPYLYENHNAIVEAMADAIR